MNRIALLLILFSLPLFGQLPFNEDTSADLKINSFVYGTLLQPATPSTTLAIIISGSGATDRDGNSQMARNNSLKKLAQGLASKGIASFRYDKRVLTLMRQGALQEQKLRFDDFVTDAVATAQYFIQKGQFDNIYFIGHSQGALVAMLAAQKVDISGIVSLSGAGQTIDKTIVSQIELQMPDLKENAISAFNSLRENGKVKDFSPALASIFRAEVQPFMASWMQYNPRREIRKLKVPTLIVSGTKDLQVAVAEAELLKKAKPDATLVLIEDMNHVLVTIEGDDLVNSKSYNQTNRPLTPELLESLSDFIKG